MMLLYMSQDFKTLISTLQNAYNNAGFISAHTEQTTDYYTHRMATVNMSVSSIPWFLPLVKPNSTEYEVEPFVWEPKLLWTFILFHQDPRLL
jgi:hypothetical protein